MAYSQGGLIAATDYNGFVGTATTSGSLNYVWSTGNGQYGYGQTAVSQAATSAGLVTATQWATMINTLNSVSKHQSGGSGTGIAAPTAGNQINYLSTLSSSIATVNTNALVANSQGSTTTGSTFSPTVTATNGTAYGPTTFATRTVTFSSGDAARYFFNSGGQLNLVIISVGNNDSTARSTDAVTTMGTYFAGMSAFKATSNGTRTGTGGTQTGTYTSGYYGLTTSAQSIAIVKSSSATYTSDTFTLNVLSNGAQGSNADKGSVISFQLIYASTHAGSFNDTLNVTVNHRIDIVYPESTNLTSSWGTPVVA
jgi:hypothetical protein